MAKVDQYEKDGQIKGKYIEVGVILSNSNGDYALLNPDVNLAGALMKQRVNLEQKGKGDMVMCSIFDNDNQQSQKPETAQSSGQNTENPAGGLETEDIPW